MGESIQWQKTTIPTVAFRITSELLGTKGLDVPALPVGLGMPCPRQSWYAAGPMNLVVNGESRAAAPGATVAALLTELGLDPQQVAVERNRDIVPRVEYSKVALSEGDQLEIVTFVGGG